MVIPNSFRNPNVKQTLLPELVSVVRVTPMEKKMKKSILAFLMTALLAFTANAKSLVVYFSVPESTKTTGLTRNEENSLVVIDGKALGNVQYAAEVIAEETGADIFRLEPTDAYPTDHSTLLKRAAEEQRKNFRPKIKGSVNLADYDTIFVGYPIWNNDMPPILYSFFDDYDLSGKRIIPFTVHGGSGLVRTVQSIAKEEPKANVERNAFSESRNTIDSAKGRIVSWLKKIGF